MSSESLSVNYEMATVLFIDIVGYSMQPIDRQMEILSTLQTVVKESVSYQRAQADKELIAIPSGDGMALVFLRSPVMPVRCALIRKCTCGWVSTQDRSAVTRTSKSRSISSAAASTSHNG